MRWLPKHRHGRRLPASSADPVAAALDGDVGSLTCRLPDVVPAPEELPGCLEVADCVQVDGFNTVVLLADEIHDYCDPYADGLDQALADQPGVVEVLAEDREVIYLRTDLALLDVKAAVVRAVLEVNRSPRPPAQTGVLPDDVVGDLAAAVTPLLAQSGFANTRAGVRYFYREGRDGFLQSVAFAPGLGAAADGSSHEGRLWVLSGTHVPGFGPHEPQRPDLVAPAHCGQPAYHWVAPAPAAVREVLTGQVLPALDATRDRAGLASWVAEDPNRLLIPAHRPTYARLFAQWGLTEESARVLAHIDRNWRSLREHPDTRRAHELLRDRRRGC